MLKAIPGSVGGGIKRVKRFLGTTGVSLVSFQATMPAEAWCGDDILIPVGRDCRWDGNGGSSSTAWLALQGSVPKSPGHSKVQLTSGLLHVTRDPPKDAHSPGLPDVAGRSPWISVPRAETCFGQTSARQPCSCLDAAGR